LTGHRSHIGHLCSFGDSHCIRYIFTPCRTLSSYLSLLHLGLVHIDVCIVATIIAEVM
jgi:hypothetical protein